MANWKRNEKTNLLPILSLSALSPSSSLTRPSLAVLCPSEILEEQQTLPVCPGITVCDFSLTSQAALWHGGMIVSGGWKPFCHGRVEKDKAVPQSFCLAEHCRLVSPAWRTTEPGTWVESSHEGQNRSFDLFTYSLGSRMFHMRVWWNGGTLRIVCPAGGRQCTGGFCNASLTWRGWLPFKQWPIVSRPSVKPRHIGSILSQVYTPRRLDQLVRTMAALS